MGIGYLEEMFMHFDAVNSPNNGFGGSENLDGSNKLSGNSDAHHLDTVSNENNAMTRLFCGDDYTAKDLSECYSTLDPILLDPDITALSEYSFVLKDLVLFDSGPLDGFCGDCFIPVIHKRNRSKESDFCPFALSSDNPFECLLSYPSPVGNLYGEPSSSNEIGQLNDPILSDSYAGFSSVVIVLSVRRFWPSHTTM